MIRLVSFPSLAAWSAMLVLAPAAWAQQPAPAASAQDTLSRAAASVGVKRCLPAITRLARLNVQGSRAHDVLLDWDRQRPDAGPVFSLIGLEYPNAGMAASITAVPDAAAGTCTVAAERITVAPFTCASIAESELAGYRMTRLLPVYAVYTDPKEPGSSVSLIDSPPGCLVIRRFVEYNWKDPAAAPAAAPPVRR
ncbi:hypothetical protein [Xenophilus azovorans]|uniref:hypothetical protein n=1 Tax=Xenophilus azovorans TaxID=151755 RepID=UPI00056FDED5|nr:hypothetical protein [Xenophilus azovorans]